MPEVFECDNCGTMLEEGDQFVTVLAKMSCSGMMFVNLRFCCTKCADAFAKAHTKEGMIGVMPCMTDIDDVPNPSSHDFIEWRYCKGKHLEDLTDEEREQLGIDDADCHSDCKRESWDTEDYSDDPDQESCTWGNQHGVDDYEDASYDYDEEDGPEDDDNDIWEG